MPAPEAPLEGLAKSLDEAGGAFWVRPVSPLSGETAARALAAGGAIPLAGGQRAFALVELIVRAPGTESGMQAAVCSLAEARRWAAAQGVERRLAVQLDRIATPRGSWAGLDLAGPLVMGIVNVTPDSFSDGGRTDATDAIAHGMRLIEAGADILDVGGESTRPGATPVPPEEEIPRVEPVVRGLAEAGAVVSIDTRNAATMARALAAGARILNDVSALEGDPGSLAVAAASDAPVVLMHMRGEPRTMQQDPVYDCAPLDVLDYLEGRIAACEAAGLPRTRLAVDPGIGFGKTLRHNLELLARLSLLHATGCPILLGASRKSFIAKSAARGETAPERLPGSLAAELAGLDQGVQILRVHDVAETRQAIEVWRNIAGAG
jgi:dihydropteroate synthase